jgi:hypothetical protein
MGYIPSRNADMEEGKAAVFFNREIAALSYPLWYMCRFTGQKPDSHVQKDL